MKRLLLTILMVLVAFDAFGRGGSFSAPSRGGGGYSAPSRSYSAPSRTYSAPARSPSYSAPARTTPAPRYVAPPVKAPSQSYSEPSYTPRRYYNQQNTTVIQQQSSGFGLMHYLMFWQLLSANRTQDPPGMNCSGGGCSQRTCTPL